MLDNARQTLHRARRLAKIASAGRKMRRSPDEPSRRLARQALCRILADARGIPMKVGQLLVTGKADDPLEPLLYGVDPLPLPTVTPVIEQSLGCPLDAIFSHFSSDAVAASLGQVHRATLRTGAEVAVKVQYPFIRDAVHAELRLLGLIPGVGPVKKWGFDLAGYQRVLRETLELELDYESEARRQMRFAGEVGVEGLVVPRVIDRWSSSRVLVQQFETGATLSEAAAWPKVARVDLARILLETLFRSLFHSGLVHGDPHPGNYRFRHDEGGVRRVVLLDYGCTLEVPLLARDALLKLILSRRGQCSACAFECFVAMGFSERHLGPIADRLDTLADALLAPFLTQSSFDTRRWALGPRLEHLLGELRWWFRAAGPPELLILLRAFQGVAQKLEALDVALPWWPLLRRATRDAAFERARHAELPRVQLDGLRPASARLLKVLVSQSDETLATFAYPASEALRLTEIVPPEVQSRLVARGIDLAAVQADLDRNGLAIGPLLDHTIDARRFRVWLE